jgi:hypothetical protein
MIPFLDPAATAPPNKLEIHGEISFYVRLRKRVRLRDRYLNPAWNSRASRGIEP